jgi:heat-inducible transcriptional repressor
MAGHHPIGPRERQILTALVETYISTGEPVGSVTLSKAYNKEGLSPATIRNVMADLAEGGYIEQPHTSAGRIPTASAYRFYVDQISGRGQITEQSRELITGSLTGVGDVQEFLERTSRVLSLISSGVGVAVSGVGKKNALDHIYFTRLANNKILAVVVTTAGVVRDRVLRVTRDLTQVDLETAANFINENFRGWTIADIRGELVRRLEQQRNEYDRLMQAVNELNKAGALETIPVPPSVFVEGVANLVDANADRDRLTQMLRTLEERQKVAELLSAYLDAQQEAVRVVIGLEEAAPGMKDYVLIGAPARVGSEVMGSVAVIGPTRMDYQHTITAVSYIADLFDKILNDKD